MTGLTTGSATRLVDRLERGGYVNRTPDQEDRRRVLVAPVPERVDRVTAVWDDLGQAWQALLDDHTEDELEVITRHMDRRTTSATPRCVTCGPGPSPTEAGGVGLDLDAASTLHAGRHEHPADNRSGRAARDPRARPGEVVQAAEGAARRGHRRGAGQHLRPARLERGGQDHGGEDPVHAAQGRRRDGPGQRLRRRDPGRRRPRVDQSHRAVRGGRRDPQRAGEPRPGRPAAAPQGARARSRTTC